MESKSPHIPVLLDEVVQEFIINSDINLNEKIYFIDATLGYGGHSEKILESSPNIHLIGIDRDIEAINFSKKRFEKFGNRVTFLHGTFAENIEKTIEIAENNKIIAILADIGVSSLQLDQMERGFSFDSPNLDMRMNRNDELTAYRVINNYSEYKLEQIFKDLGEIRNSKKIANSIVNSRPINSGSELSKLIEKINGRWNGTHPATQIFQAIRIEVNGELNQLDSFMNKIRDLAKNNKLNNTKIGIITFHSLEDRIVKDKFKNWEKSCICPPEAMRCVCGDNHSLGEIITKKPIVPTEKEIYINRRSRSAKLRLFKINK